MQALYAPPWPVPADPVAGFTSTQLACADFAQLGRSSRIGKADQALGNPRRDAGMTRYAKRHDSGFHVDAACLRAWGASTASRTAPVQAEYQSRRPRSTSSLTPILMEPPLRPRPWRPPSNRGLFLEVGPGYRGHQSSPQGERTPGRTQYTRFPLPWHYHPILPTDTRKNYKVPIRFHRK